jgi:hypothetical protein
VRARGWALGILGYTLAFGACSTPAPSGFNLDSGGPSQGSDSGTMPGSGTGTGPTKDATTTVLGGMDATTTMDATVASDSGACVVTNPNADMDHDGWTPNQGDCNDCNPNVNPGAIDVLLSGLDGGTPVWGDEDCSGVAGDSAKPCDQGLALADVDANDAAKAIELCQVATMTDRKYGVISSQYVRANGAPFASPGVQVGIQPNFGPNVNVQGGANMLALSSGAARIVGQTGACNAISCEYNATATPPAGFPDPDPTCPPVPSIADDVALQVQVRVPTNATGFSFSFKFHSFEYPDWVCATNGYNDQFVALMTPSPMGADLPPGATAGNISFDSNHHPVGVNIGYFSVCDPSTPTRFASHCTSSSTVTCPTLPSPYCPDGTAQLLNTGFDVWNKDGPDGATAWLESQAPATPGSIITLQFTIWDAGNGEYDSTVLVDNIKWNATAGVTTPTPVMVTTQPIPSPK